MHSSGRVCAHFICFVASTCCSHRRKTRLCSPQKHQSTCSHPLEREDSELIIDGAVGNLVWKHVGLDSLNFHPRWKTFSDYFWCIIGALLEEKPFVEYHMWWPPLKYPPSSHGIRAVGNHWKNTYHGSNCTSMEGFNEIPTVRLEGVYLWHGKCAWEEQISIMFATRYNQIILVQMILKHDRSHTIFWQARCPHEQWHHHDFLWHRKDKVNKSHWKEQHIHDMLVLQRDESNCWFLIPSVRTVGIWMHTCGR